MTEAAQSYPVTELRPCPFCGNPPVLLTINENDSFIRCYEVRCDHCGIEVSEEYKNETLNRWNIRSSGVAQAAWQPIETVPENHFTVLVYGKYGRLTAFRDVAWQWWPFPAAEPLDYTPTHWMPLPEAPVVSSTDPRCTCAAIVNPNIPHARSCPLSSTEGK